MLAGQNITRTHDSAESATNVPAISGLDQSRELKAAILAGTARPEHSDDGSAF